MNRRNDASGKPGEYMAGQLNLGNLDWIAEAVSQSAQGHAVRETPADWDSNFPEPTPADFARSKKDAARPPVFRGSDFAMRFEQGRWSEDRLIEAINLGASYRAIPYGRSQVGPEDKEQIAAYWAEYVAAETHGKRPDLLVLRAEDYDWALSLLGDDPTIVKDAIFDQVVERAVCGIEAENSLWVARDMADFATRIPLTKKDPKSPNVWVKDQDVPGLKVWMHHHRTPVLVVQVFYDLAFAITLAQVLSLVGEIERAPADTRDALQKRNGLFIREQEYADARTGSVTKKTVYVSHHSIATPFGVLRGEVAAEAKVIFEPKGKILPYVSFKGGTLEITLQGLSLLDRIASRRS